MVTTILSKTAVHPTFLFIGADRCGSKSLHNILRQHPECYAPSIADPMYFDQNYNRGSEWYLQLFENAPPSALAIGEFSHNYLQSKEVAKRIAKDLPDVKLLVTLRHPVERTFSSYAAAFSAGLTRAHFDQAIRDNSMFIGYSLYADRLEAYYALFPREQIKVLFFDDLQTDPRAFAEQAFDYLGLRMVDEIDYGRRMSALSKSRFPLSGTLSKRGAIMLRKLGWVNLLGRLKSNATFRSLFYKPYSAENRPQISGATRRALNEIFAPQIDRLEKMLGRDLSAWRV